MAAVVEGFTFGETTSTTDIALARPAGIVAGELLLLMVFLRDISVSDLPWVNVPGFFRWTFCGFGASDLKAAFYYRIADGTEAATTNVRLKASSVESYGGYYMRISGARAVQPIHVTGIPTDDLPAQLQTIREVTTEVDDTLVIGALVFDGADASFSIDSGAGWSITDQRQHSSGGAGNWSAMFAEKIVATAGATGDLVIDCTANDGASSLQISIAPSAAAAPTFGAATFTANDTGATRASILTLTKPAGVQIGDALVIMVMSNHNHLWVTPTGWTAGAAHSNTTRPGYATFHRVADGTEAATEDISTSGFSGQLAGFYVRVADAHPTDPVLETRVDTIHTSAELFNDTWLRRLMFPITPPLARDEVNKVIIWSAALRIGPGSDPWIINDGDGGDTIYTIEESKEQGEATPAFAELSWVFGYGRLHTKSQIGGDFWVAPDQATGSTVNTGAMVGVATQAPLPPPISLIPPGACNTLDAVVDHALEVADPNHTIEEVC